VTCGGHGPGWTPPSRSRAGSPSSSRSSCRCPSCCRRCRRPRPAPKTVAGAPQSRCPAALPSFPQSPAQASCRRRRSCAGRRGSQRC
jgi:hypothetical protein